VIDREDVFEKARQRRSALSSFAFFLIGNVSPNFMLPILITGRERGVR
jgi:hypothetical protein